MRLFTRLEPRGRLMTPLTPADAGTAQRSRLRLVVVQVLVFSLFATLFARLYYLQVVTGDDYHAQAAVAVGARDRRAAAARPDRRRPGPPAGRQPHRLGGLGRPHPARQARPATTAQRLVAAARAGGGQAVAARCSRRLVTCGDPGSVRGTLLERLAVPAGAGRPRRRASRWRCGSSSSPRTTRRVRRPAAERARLPPAVRRQPRRTSLGYLSPITAGELDAGRRTTTTPRSTAPARSAAPASSRQYDRWLRGMPGYQQVAVDSMGRVLGDDGEVAGQPGDTLVTSIDAKVQAVVERAARRAITTARATYDPVTHRNYAADSGAAVVMRGQHRPRRRDGQPADVRPVGVGRRHHQQAARAALLRRRPATRCSPARPRASSRRARRGSRS